MNKNEFLNALRTGLKALRENDINQYTQYYSEMIDDMVEDGLSEQQAIENIGTADKIATQILDETSLPKSPKKEKHKFKVWEIILLALGSPIWVSLLIAVFTVAVALLASVFSIIVSFYAAASAIGVSAFASIPCAIVLFTKGNVAGGIFLAGAGLICAGLCIFVFIGTNKLAKQVFKLIRSIFVRIKSSAKRKENAK